MKDPKAPRTGIIECEKGSASFYMNDFSFCFMNNTIKRIPKHSGDIQCRQSSFHSKETRQFLRWRNK